jgi:hypothetical protein
MLQRVDDAMGWAGSAGLGADLWARVCLRYDRLVEEGRSVCGEDLGALMVSALTVESGDLDLEPACQELEDRIRRYHLDVCLEHVQGSEQARPSERLMRRCFKGWPVSPKVMVRKLMTPENRRMKGKPVHGAQEVDLAAALFDRVSRDSAVEVMMSQARTLPDAETVRRAAHGAAVPVLAALLRAAGVRHRQIAELLGAMGALKPGAPAAQEKAVQRAALDGERLLDGEAPSKRRSLAYTHHPIVEFLVGDETFLDQLGEDPDGAGAMLAAMAGDLRAMKVRMALVDFSPTVVNAFQTLDREQWPPVLQRLSASERAVLADYGAERLSRTDAELALGRHGAEHGAPLMRPVWRLFVASSLTRMALQDRAAVQDVLRQVAMEDARMDEDLAATAEAHQAVAQSLVDYARAYLWLDRVDLAVLAEGSAEEAKAAFAEAVRAARGHERLTHDLLLRAVTVEVKARLGDLTAAQVADQVEPALRRFVAACESPALAADNLRQYLGGVAPNVARVLAERTRTISDASLPSA